MSSALRCTLLGVAHQNLDTDLFLGPSGYLTLTIDSLNLMNFTAFSTY